MSVGADAPLPGAQLPGLYAKSFSHRIHSRLIEGIDSPLIGLLWVPATSAPGMRCHLVATAVLPRWN
jgi:hypothetical protein